MASTDFDAYIKPVETPPTSDTTAGAGWDWQDIGKGAVGGLGRGVTGLLGLPGDVSNLMAKGGEWVGNKLGLPPLPDDIRQANERSRPFTSTDIRKPIESVTGPFYEPHTIPGQYASTAGEFAPSALFGGGGMAARTVNTLAPAFLSETAGQITKGTDEEPWARAIAGIGGGLAVGKAITPAPPAIRARQNAAAVLDREGIPISAGQRTGSKFVQLAEETAGEMPASMGAWQKFRQGQLEALNKRTTERTFDPAELQRRGIPAEGSHLPHSDVFSQGKQSLKDEYTRLSQANHLKSDVPLIDDLTAVQTKYERNVLPSQRASGKQDIEEIFHDIANNLGVNGTMPGDVYQSIRSRLGTQAKTAFKTDPELGRALKDTQAALDRAMERNLSPADAAAWKLNNQRYANMKQLVPAVAKGGEYMTPAGIAQAVRSGRAEQAAARRIAS